ncbi:hypothetical protein Ahy_A03g012297 [Arachis hypogaea]|uniref:SWIM-type domain-containing protein n=1 Tax=Arachis hypogaea TaxID=3818 RepID=A0A445DSZ4_ARAHY|nr:hypothetical protein Ahy_A03g012297 [Arachis hypogaea]
MASPSPSMERRVAGDEDTTGGEADHGVGLVEGVGFAGLESYEYDLQEDETENDHPIEGERSEGMESEENDFQEDDTEHDRHAEADVDSGDAVELEDGLDGAGGMSENYAEDEFYAVDSGESIGWIDFLNLSAEDVLRFNFADVDIAFEFYQQYAKHHGFGARRSRSEKRGEVRIRQEFVCHRQGFRSPKFYSMPNRQKRPRAETRCECPARMLLRMDDESGRWHVAFFSDAHNHHVLELRFSSMLPGHQRMSEADIQQMNDMRKGGIGVSRIHGFMASLAGGYHNVPYTTRDMHNVNAKQRREGGVDAESCLRACAMRVVDSEDNGSYFIHTVSRYGTPGKEWRVVATSDTREVRCTCMRMECFGVPCEHIIAVLVLNNVHEIPRSLILPRWTKDAKLVAVESMGVIWDSVQLTQHWCLMDWYRKVCKIACQSTEKFQFARDIAVLMLKHFENEDAGNSSFQHEGPPTEGGRPPARNPPRRSTKGNGGHGGKKTQRCRLCREVGHNRTTCPERRTMEPFSSVAEDMDSMDTDMVYDNLSGDLYATAEIPSFECSDSDTQAGFANSDFAGAKTSGPVMSLAD